MAEMTFGRYVELLDALLKENPEAKNLPVITAKDDEGNGYNKVYYKPGLVNFDGWEIYPDQEPNAVCVN